MFQAGSPFRNSSGNRKLREYSKFREFELSKFSISGDVIACALQVHKALGSGFLESVYQRAFELEMTCQKIPFTPQQPLNVNYRNTHVGKFVADFVVADMLIIEIKAIQNINSNCEAQLINYLKATGIKVGLLFNFGSCSLQICRKVNRLGQLDQI